MGLCLFMNDPFGNEQFSPNLDRSFLQILTNPDEIAKDFGRRKCGPVLLLDTVVPDLKKKLSTVNNEEERKINQSTFFKNTALRPFLATYSHSLYTGKCILFKYLCLAEIPVGKTGVPGVKQL